MFAYTAYGLGIHSALALPELVAGAPGQDVVIGLGDAVEQPAKPTVQDGCCHATAEEVRLAYDGVGAFRICRGREIVVDPAPGVEEGVLRLFLLGAALGVLLHQRGFLILHGSAVAVGEGAAVFLGASGWGKSTTAAALHARGHPVVADDVVAVRDDSGQVLVYPGFPQLKLWPEVAASLGELPESVPALHPALEKWGRPARRGFSAEPLPLRRVYVLADGAARAVEWLGPQEAMRELLQHSYAAGLLRPTGAAPAHFRQCGRLIATSAVRRLRRPRSLPDLPELARLVEEDLAAAGAHCAANGPGSARER
jgi:hypothetical protein